jgi:hypothetical protein
MATKRIEAGLVLESGRSHALLEDRSTGIDPGPMRDVLRMYCRALSGHDVKVEQTAKLVEKNIGWSRPELPATDGKTIYLPARIDKFVTKAQNSEFLKIMLTHQLGYITFGSFDFRFLRPSTKFRDARLRLDVLALVPAVEQDSTVAPCATDLTRFFRLFPNRRLALDIFSVLENTRIEARLLDAYRGLAAAYQVARAQALAARPDLSLLPPLETLIEYMIRISLGEDHNLKVPAPHTRVASTLGHILNYASHGDATVEDSAEATLRIYALVTGAVKEPLGRPSAAEQAYAPAQNVHYRGDAKWELAQLLALALSGKRGDRLPVTEEQIAEILQDAPEVQCGTTQTQGGARQQQASSIRGNLTKELAQKDPQVQGCQGSFAYESDEIGGPLEATRPGTFVYDEWDFFAGDYQPRWCLVQERVLACGDAAFYRQTLLDHALLARRIRGELELLLPQTHRKVKRLEDGEEQDLDALIEAVIDLRSGVTPSEKVFWRRNKNARSVAVVLLLDMSASTAEVIDDSNAHRKPVVSRSGRAGPSYKRVIDVEKEGIVLLVNALEMLGDRYGIYGFSGYGRANVEFYLIKELEEGFTAEVAMRIDRIAPVHTTRMGPAIRHATAKLARQDARSKFLILISDGRPQDRGYSRDGMEKEYAVQDTRMAFAEARRRGITPFCLTVDKAGNDYMKTMMSEFGYEVLADVSLLPRRLPRLYRMLTR